MLFTFRWMRQRKHHCIHSAISPVIPCRFRLKPIKLCLFPFLFGVPVSACASTVVLQRRVLQYSCMWLNAVFIPFVRLFWFSCVDTFAPIHCNMEQLIPMISVIVCVCACGKTKSIRQTWKIERESDYIRYAFSYIHTHGLRIFSKIQRLFSRSPAKLNVTYFTYYTIFITGCICNIYMCIEYGMCRVKSNALTEYCNKQTLPKHCQPCIVCGSKCNVHCTHNIKFQIVIVAVKTMAINRFRKSSTISNFSIRQIFFDFCVSAKWGGESAFIFSFGILNLTFANYSRVNRMDGAMSEWRLLQMKFATANVWNATKSSSHRRFSNIPTFAVAYPLAVHTDLTFKHKHA